MMKKLYNSLAGGIVLAAIVTSCAQELVNPEVDITSVRCSISQIDTEEDFATGIVDTLPATKATFSNNSFLWSAGDRIGIVPNSGAQIYFEVDEGAGTSTASFDGGSWAMKATETFYAYYPLYPDMFLSKDQVPVDYTGQTQNGNNNNLHTGDFWTLYTTGTTAVGNVLNFSFNHLTSFFKTYVTVPAGTYTRITFSAPSDVFIQDGYFDLSAQTPAIVGTTMTDELSLDLQNVTFADETELTGYLVLAPVDITGIPITVTVYKDGTATYEYTLTKASPMVAAKTYAFRATSLTQVAASAAQANALFAAGATAVTITEPLTQDATVVLPDTDEPVTLTLPTTASSSKLTVSYAPGAAAYPTTLDIAGPEGADLDIQAPNSTVTVNGVAYDQITSRTAANTCIIPTGVTVSVLKVIQGGVQVYGTVSQIDLSEQEDDAVISVSGSVTSLLGEDDEEYVPVTGMTMSQSAINLNVGTTETLNATLLPYGAYPHIIWTSSNEAVATVSAGGVVTAMSVGSTTITAKTISGGFTATCEVTVSELNYSNEPFTITSNGSTSISIIKEGTPNDISLEYRKRPGSWAAYTIGSVVDLLDGEVLQFRAGEGGNSSFSKNYPDYYRLCVNGAGTINVSGNITSLLDKTLNRSNVPTHAYLQLFYSCVKLVDASNLKLPATTLAERCYWHMFSNCTGMTSTPMLPATTLAKDCYTYMFSGCTGLTSAPELPATTLAEGCYWGMFQGCINITAPPVLPATCLEKECYSRMFWGCTGLTSAPVLPATTLANSCYGSMFNGCTGLTSAPVLPATTLADYCYWYMFSGCTGLISAPELPVTTLAYRCYGYMFNGCTGLTSAPELPATNLTEYCYNGMFSGCTGLTSAPELPATSLANYCYNGMFSGCSSLNYIKMLATDISASSCLSNWVLGVSDTGTFVKNPSATWDVTGSSGVPSGWTVLGGIPTSVIVLSEIESANCYIINSSGYYAIKATKGNTDESIGEVRGVKVLWESRGTSVAPSKGEYISSVNFENELIYFRTNDAFKNGNAVIAAYSDNACSDGNVLWSWHIWFTDTPLKQIYYNYSGYVMDRNLGAINDKSVGLMYQWGRKDPFMGAISTTSNTLAKATPSFASAMKTTSLVGTIDYAIAHPTTFLLSNDSLNDWIYYGTSTNTPDHTRWAQTKTIYDPCPIGWHIPPSTLWEKASGGSEHYGYIPWLSPTSHKYDLGNDDTIWYPTAGAIRNNDGGLYNVGSWGGTWSYTKYVPGNPLAGPNYLSKNFAFWVTDSQAWGLANSNHANGYPVRCVSDIEEDPTAVKSVYLVSSISLGVGDTYQLNPSVSPSSATNKSIVFHSTNTSIATVSSDGLITAVASGQCRIIATAASGKAAATNLTVN